MLVGGGTRHRIETENLGEITRKMQLGKRENVERMEWSWVNRKGKRVN